VVPRSLIGVLDPVEVRKQSPDGAMGGVYQRSDEDMSVVWKAGVDEVRELLETGWLA
jgi:creatinine amidohydrolase